MEESCGGVAICLHDSFEDVIGEIEGLQLTVNELKTENAHLKTAMNVMEVELQKLKNLN